MDSEKIEALERQLKAAQETIADLQHWKAELRPLTVETLRAYVVELRSNKNGERKVGRHAYGINNRQTIDEMFEFFGMIGAGLSRGNLDREHVMALAARLLRLYEDGVEPEEIPF